MPDLKDERDYAMSVAERRRADINEMYGLLAQLRARADDEQAARERAQQALREIEDALSEEVPSACVCEDCTRLRAIAAIARKGLEG
jgi:hypothetical protein